MAENTIIHEISLAGYKATSTGGMLDLGTWGSYGIEKLHLTLDAAWQDLTITAFFNVKGEVVAKQVVGKDGYADVPWEATKESTFSGRIVFEGSINGQRGGGGDLNYKVSNHSEITDIDPVPTDDRWNQFVTENKEYRDGAFEAAEIANARAEDAEAASDDGKAAARAAKASETAAKASENAAAASEDNARISAGAAAVSEGNAAASADKAKASETAAAESASNAAASAVISASNAAQAETQKTAAAKSASDAQGYMQTASGAATAANASAENAAGSKAAAASSAKAAAASAAAAAGYANDAAGSASSASQSASDAESAKEAAENSQAATSESANAAAGNAAAAKKSEEAAGESATNAASSEANAKKYAASASGDAANAKKSATSAATSEKNAAASEATASEAAQRAAEVKASIPETYDELSQAIVEVKKSIPKKLDTPANPVVGQLLRIKTVNEDGSVVLESVENTGGVTDVTVNGVSIVEGDVAKVPLASVASPGVVQLGNSSDLVGRADNKAVRPSDIDSAAKLALCDGKGAAWTNAEKTGAWSRLNTIKDVIDSVAIAGCTYLLGEQTYVNITLPSDALPGQKITIVFSSGTKACTLAVDAENFDFVPKAGATNLITFLCIATDKWLADAREG